MRNALIVAWKEFRTFFQTPIGYVILVLFTFLSGLFFFVVDGFFGEKQATIRGLLMWLPWLFLVFAPAITMRLWAEERRAGTIEILLTLPLKDWQIVLGKFLSAVGVVAGWLICMLPLVGVVAWFGEPDPGPIVGGLIGALLLGAAYAAIGVAASAMTENQIISLIVGVILSFVFFLAGWDRFVAIAPDSWSGFLHNLSLHTHFLSIARGVIDSRDLIYYASFIAFFLVVNVWAVRHASGKSLLRGLLGAVLLIAHVAVVVAVLGALSSDAAPVSDGQKIGWTVAGILLVAADVWVALATDWRRMIQARGLVVPLAGGILLAVNYIGDSLFFRIDLTQNGRYTLADDTERILGNIEDDLRLTAYLSSDVPPYFSNLRRDIEDMVHEFELLSNRHLRVEIVDPDKSEEGKKAAEAAGFRPAPLGGGDADKMTIKNAYLALQVEYGDKTEKLPFIDSTENLEYDLIRRIAKMTRREVVKIAWQVGDPMSGMPEMPGMPRPPSGDKHSPTTDLRFMDQVLKQEYETTTIDLKSAVPDEVKAVVVCNADNLDDVQKFHLDQYLMKGGGVIVLADGNAEQSFGGGGMGRTSLFMRGGNDKLPEDYFSHYGFKVNKDLVLDRSCGQAPVMVDVGGFQMRTAVPYPPFVRILPENVNQDHPATAGLAGMLLPFASSLTLDPKPGVTATPLVRSTHQAKHLEQFMMVSPESYLPKTREDEVRMAEELERDYKEQFVLVALLEGNFQSYFLAHEVPAAVRGGVADLPDGHGADDGHDHGGDGFVGDDGDAGGDGGGGGDGGDGVDDGDGTVRAKERDADPAAPAPAAGDEAAPVESDGAAPPPGDGTAKPSGGGPRIDEAPETAEDPQDPPQEVPAAPAAPTAAPAPMPVAPTPAAALPEFEYLKQSTKPGKYAAIGNSMMLEDNIAQNVQENALLMLNLANYMASENLSGLRAKKINDAPFAEATETQVTMAKVSSWYLPIAILLGLGLFVYFWRRELRPAAARRRMNQTNPTGGPQGASAGKSGAA